MEFFTADVHFCDPTTMECDHRPFKNIHQYDNFVIKDWNKTAKKGDTIYVAGDLFSCNSHDPTWWIAGLKLIKKVKADVVLILGNNEQRIIDKFFDGNFEAFANHCKERGIKEVYKFLDLNIWGKKFHVVHQAIHADKSKINLFGHTHLCSGTYHPYGLCVSTDLNHFRLYTKEILLQYLQRKHDYWEPDDNCNYINPFLKEVDGKIINVTANRKCYKEYMKHSNFKVKIK